MNEADEIAQNAQRLKGIFSEAVLRHITPTWAQKHDPFDRLARTLYHGAGLRVEQ